jgi:hypothetical protein
MVFLLIFIKNKKATLSLPESTLRKQAISH